MGVSNWQRLAYLSQNGPGNPCHPKPLTQEKQSMKKIMIMVVNWMMAVIKIAITWVAARLLGTAILAIITKTWPGLAILTIGG